MTVKRSKSQRLQALMKKVSAHQYGAHHTTLHDSATHPSTRAKLKRKRGGRRQRREAQLRTLQHKLYYLLQDELKKG